MNRRQAARAIRWGCRFIWLWLVLVILPGAAQAQTERVTGEWAQFILDNEVWRPLGVYRVEQADDGYRMTPVRQAEGPSVTPSRGLSDVRFSGEDWSFNSDWGDGNVGQFRLRRAAPSVYLGWSYLGDERRNFNMWVLVR